MYGDSDASAKTDGTRAGTADTFSAAHLDFFSTANVKKWTFLAETMFEADAVSNTYSVDVERVEVGYLVDEKLRVFAGRFHTAIGYYNDAFHHGLFFMVPIARPVMVEFEDGGGLIPAHNVGLHADGRFSIGDDHLRYDVEVANGRAADPTVILNKQDTNRAKAFNLRLRYEPSGLLDGLIIGGNVYFDSIPANTMAASSETGFPFHFGPLHELIVGGHAAYFEHQIHFVSEALMIQHTETDTGAVHRTFCAFGEAGYQIDSLTPYVRYEYTRFPTEGDPYFLKTAADGFQRPSIGMKHFTTDNIALKLEAAALFSRRSGTDPSYSLTGQLAWAF